jgi:hypothetical protein
MELVIFQYADGDISDGRSNYLLDLGWYFVWTSHGAVFRTASRQDYLGDRQLGHKTCALFSQFLLH